MIGTVIMTHRCGRQYEIEVQLRYYQPYKHSRDYYTPDQEEEIEYEFFFHDYQIEPDDYMPETEAQNFYSNCEKLLKEYLRD
jgi:hypothetical protein